MALLQTSHENASVIGQAWFFLEEKYKSKSIHTDIQFEWKYMNKAFAKQAKELVQDDLWIHHSMLRPDAKDYAVIEKAASNAIQDAIKTYLEDNPDEAKAMEAKQMATTSRVSSPIAVTPLGTGHDNTKMHWKNVFQAMKSVHKDDKDDGVIETSKYAIAFFRLMSSVVSLRRPACIVL